MNLDHSRNVPTNNNSSELENLNPSLLNQNPTEGIDPVNGKSSANVIIHTRLLASKALQQQKKEAQPLTETALEKEFFAQPQQEAVRIAETRRVQSEWVREENQRLAVHEQKMRSRSAGEKLRSAAGALWNGVASILPGAASREINKNLQEQGLKPSMSSPLKGLSNDLKSRWNNFTSNFQVAGDLNRELDRQLKNGELSVEEHAVLRKPSVRERLSSAGQWLSSKITAATHSGKSTSRNGVRGSGGSDSGNGNEGGGGNGGNKPQKQPKTWRRLVAGVVAGAALLSGYGLFKNFSKQESTETSSSAPAPTVPAHASKPQQKDEVADQSLEEKTPPPVDKKEEVVAQPKPRLYPVAPKKAKSTILPKERPIGPKLPEKAEEKKQPEPPKVVKKQPQEKLNPLQVYYAELQAQWKRIQNLDSRLEFAYGLHSSAKPARTMAQVLTPEAVPYQPRTSYLKCTFNCGTEDKAQIVQLLNDARSLLSEGRFNDADSSAVVASKIVKGRQNVAAARPKIDEAEKLFHDQEEAAKRVYRANRVGYADINRKNAREKLAFVERELMTRGLPTNGQISLSANPRQNSYSVHQGRSQYSVKMSTTSQVFDLGAIREKLMKAEADLDLHASKLTPKEAQALHQSILDVNFTLDRLVPMVRSGHVKAVPPTISHQDESKTHKKPAIRKAGEHIAPTIKVRPKPARAKLIHPRQQKPVKKASYAPKKQEEKKSFASRMMNSMKRFASRAA
ncbi:hypothetical protein KC725_05075 [Candidatus Peregrinibacteria bacterium]|nr:hypothetical protein [Candidatus Peregrinibacteria bacterium]